MKYEEISEEDALSLLGEGIHTGFRKGTDAAGSSLAWRAISAPDSGWEDALKFFLDGLDFMGFAIVKKVEE